MVQLHRWLSFKMGPLHCIGAFYPYSLSAASYLRHRFRTVGTMSRSRFLPEDNSTVAESHTGFYWHPGDLLKFHRVFRLARPPLCSEGELFGLLWIVRWRNPSCALVRHFLQRAIPTGPSSFCLWESGLRCLSTPAVVQFLLPAEWPYVCVV
jgi:hypothetical protein